MMHMTRTINEELLARLPDRDQPAVGVSCVTCHGGLARPETGDTTAAIAAYEKVLEIRPQNAAARRRLCEIRR